METMLLAHASLSELAARLSVLHLPEEKWHVLAQEQVAIPESILDLLEKVSVEEKIVLVSLCLIGQSKILLACQNSDQRNSIIQQLLPVEKFYSVIGGLIGYHLRMMQLLEDGETNHLIDDDEHQQKVYLPTHGIDISRDSLEVRKAVIEGIRLLPLIAQIFPLGGAADRLRLRDEKTGESLPAACLPFLGKTLFEGMLDDLQSYEHLHYQLFNEQVQTPIAVMTSSEKNNHTHILAICEENSWFGRSADSFRFFCQPAVPTLNRQGLWCLQGLGQLLMKPGGHGVIWRLAKENGIFDWFFAQKRSKALVRQINNPVANTDHGILAFIGIGLGEDKLFGFASCPRLVKASEGINVLIEMKHADDSYEYVLTNIEYCDFKRYGIVDEPVDAGSPYSKFPSNTNILFVDLRKILEVVSQTPIPGILVNMKKTVYVTETGKKCEEEIARLESTMQNIADFFVEKRNKPLAEAERGKLSTFLTYNQRTKTISTTKREFVLGTNILETPEGCFLDVLRNSRELLQVCNFKIPLINDPNTFFNQGPSFIFLFHPALGPLYSIIAQKIRGGKIAYGSEIQLQIACVDFENLDVDGSLLIHADWIVGHKTMRGLHYSNLCGKCTLRNVHIMNRGIDTDMPNVYWKNEIARQETCHIIIRGCGEFFAENVTLIGDYFIEVPDQTRVIAYMNGSQVCFSQQPIARPSWHWNYWIDDDSKIRLTNTASHTLPVE